MTGVAPAGTLTVNGIVPEAPPPGVPVKTLTLTTPALSSWLAEIWAVSCVALTKAVGRASPFHSIRDDAMKLLPVTVSVIAADP